MKINELKIRLFAHINWLKKKILLRFILKLPYFSIVFLIMYLYKGDIYCYIERIIEEDIMIIKYIILHVFVFIFKTIAHIYRRIGLYLVKFRTKWGYKWRKRIKISKILVMIIDIIVDNLYEFIYYKIPYIIMMSIFIEFIIKAFPTDKLYNSTMFMIFMIIIIFFISQFFKTIFILYFRICINYVYKYIKKNSRPTWYKLKFEYKYKKSYIIYRFKQLIKKKNKKKFF